MSTAQITSHTAAVKFLYYDIVTGIHRVGDGEHERYDSRYYLGITTCPDCMRMIEHWRRFILQDDREIYAGENIIILSAPEDQIGDDFDIDQRVEDNTTPDHEIVECCVPTTVTDAESEYLRAYIGEASANG